MNSLDRRAVTSSPINPLLANRHSTRAFADSELTDAQVASLLEAARWAPSCGNTQPSRFIVARTGTVTFKRVVAQLNPGNQKWAAAAAALIVGVRLTANEKGPLPFAAYDLGQAMAHLSFQALTEGLTVRQMAGFDAAGLAAEFGLDETLVPTTIAAVGTAGDPAVLEDDVRAPDVAPRQRIALDELVIGD
ncbi:nitroreductase family protein [Stackebrandtia soli]|uniref:nitroreductase family protein n=1 Tax=Stackebrandtia soli TaxID=1892856 RepID=UPI0039EAC563